jgi:hypothetical protein
MKILHFLRHFSFLLLHEGITIRQNILLCLNKILNYMKDIAFFYSPFV